MHPDGIMLSNGPGDPTENTDVIENLKKLKECQIPIFGICLGHQLMALANGAKTEKLKYTEVQTSLLLISHLTGHSLPPRTTAMQW